MNIQIFLSVILWLMIGSATAYYANQRGRDPVVWFMIGMLLGLFGLLLVFILPSGKTENKEQSIDSTHDITVFTAVPDYPLVGYYYYDRNQNRQGPLSLDDLKNAWTQKQVDKETFVWYEGLLDWKKIEELQNLLTYLAL
jgi:GYF domain 2